MTVKEQIMKLQTYKMYEGEDTVYVERDDVLKALEQQPSETVHGSTYGGVSWGGTYTPKEQQPCEDCISRDAVIKHICESKECYKDECKGRLYKRCYDLQWIYTLPSVTPQQTRWIPCSEKLPEDYGEYICTMSNDNVQECGFVPSGEKGLIAGWSTCEADGFKQLDYRDIKAWMPLPEPYKTESEVNFAVVDDIVIKSTPMPEMGENIYKTEVVMTKEIFQECYKKWIDSSESGDKE